MAELAQGPAAEGRAAEPPPETGTRPAATPLGRFSLRAGEVRRSPAVLAASLLSLAWAGIALLALRPGPEAAAGDGRMVVLSALAVLCPVALIWVVLLGARALRELRAEARALQDNLEALRSSWAQQSRGLAQRGPLERRISALDEVQRQHGQLLAGITGQDPAAAPARAPFAPLPEEEEPGLALEAPPAVQPVTVAEAVMALNFPDSPEDVEGFAALRRALEDPAMARLIRAAQDVLTLLAQDGIYMDELVPDRARVETWRRFAQGERGAAVAAIGGIHDRAGLALASGRMRADAVFRDACHHFLRQFDRSFQELEPRAGDQDIATLAESRTARAFMLLGRAAGAFD